jgi:alpha-methylacyl-CoA racemase
MLALGVVAAVWQARSSGRGQVVETSIAGAALALTPLFYGLIAGGRWNVARGDNLLDGGAPFYRCYECADGRYVAVGAIEPKFYRELLGGLGLADTLKPVQQYDRTIWPETAAILAQSFRTAPRDDWAKRFDGTDACVTPVLDWTEAPEHPQHRALASFTEIDGVVQPAAHPQFSQTPAGISGPASAPGADSEAILARLGYSAAEIAGLTALPG